MQSLQKVGINKIYTSVAGGLLRFECRLSARAALSAIHTFSSLQNVSESLDFTMDVDSRNNEAGIDETHPGLPDFVHGRSISRLTQISRARKLIILMLSLFDASQGNELHQRLIATAIDVGEP